MNSKVLIFIFTIIPWAWSSLAFDPMAPPNMEQKNTEIKVNERVSEKALLLQQITLLKNHSTAVINNTLLREKDVIDGWKVIKIGQFSVDLRKSQKTKTIYVMQLESDIKQTRKAP